MRTFPRLSFALAILTTGITAFAQYAEVDPRTLPAQITAQELAVQTEPANSDWHSWLKLAVLLADAGSYRESESAYHQTIALLRAPAPLTVADVFDHMGTMYVASGQLSNAEPLERHALAIRQNQHDSLGAGVSHMHLAMLLLGQNELRSAETEAQIAVAMLVPEDVHQANISSATPEQKMTALIDLSLVKCASGANQDAVPDLQRALEIARQNYPENSLPVGYIDFLLGQTYWKGGDSRNAGKLMAAGVEKLATVIGWGHPVYLGTLQQYRAFLVETNQRHKAQQVAAEIDRIDRSKGSFTVASGKLNP